MGKTGTESIQKPEDLLAGYVKAVCYSGFRSGQHPDRGNGAINPSEDQILEDLEIISKEPKFKLIRVYDSGENSESVLRIIKDKNLDIKVMLGIWLKAEISNHQGCAWLTEPIPEEELVRNKLDNHEEIKRGIRLANEFSNIVVAVNVGNEALVDWNDHMVPLDTVLSYVKWVKRSISQEISVADNYEWWASKGAELATELDFISIHTYPVWEDRDINEGMSYTIENILKVKKSLPGTRMVISEAGWATVSSEFRDRASERKQKIYYQQIMAWADQNNITTFFFEAFDEDWKGDPNNMMGAEKHWGLYTVDRQPKEVMIDNSMRNE